MKKFAENLKGIMLFTAIVSKHYPEFQIGDLQKDFENLVPHHLAFLDWDRTQPKDKPLADRIEAWCQEKFKDGKPIDKPTDKPTDKPDS